MVWLSVAPNPNSWFVSPRQSVNGKPRRNCGYSSRFVWSEANHESGFRHNIKPNHSLAPQSVSAPGSEGECSSPSLLSGNLQLFLFMLIHGWLSIMCELGHIELENVYSRMQLKKDSDWVVAMKLGRGGTVV